MKVLIIGAGGAIGSRLTARLTDTNHEVTGIVRSDNHVAGLQSLGATALKVPLSSPERLAEAMWAHDAVVFTAGSRDQGLAAVDRDGAINSAKAAEMAGVSRFVLLSSIFAGRPERGPEKLHPYLWAKNAADKFVEASTLEFTIVRPAFLTNSPLSGSIVLADELEYSAATISREDVAIVLTEILVQNATIHQVFEVADGDGNIADVLRGPFS